MPWLFFFRFWFSVFGLLFWFCAFWFWTFSVGILLLEGVLWPAFCCVETLVQKVLSWTVLTLNANNGRAQWVDLEFGDQHKRDLHVLYNFA